MNKTKVEYVPNHLYKIIINNMSCIDRITLDILHAPYTEHPKTYKVNMFSCHKVSKDKIGKIYAPDLDPYIILIPESKEQLQVAIERLIVYYKHCLKEKMNELEKTVDLVNKLSFEVL